MHSIKNALTPSNWQARTKFHLQKCLKDSHLEKIKTLKKITWNLDLKKSFYRKKCHKNQKRPLQNMEECFMRSSFLSIIPFVTEESNFQMKFLQFPFSFLKKLILVKIRYSEVLSKWIVHFAIDFNVKLDLIDPDFWKNQFFMFKKYPKKLAQAREHTGLTVLSISIKEEVTSKISVLENRISHYHFLFWENPDKWGFGSGYWVLRHSQRKNPLCWRNPDIFSIRIRILSKSARKKKNPDLEDPLTRIIRKPRYHCRTNFSGDLQIEEKISKNV